MPITPEDRARQEIDRQLVETGWIVQDFADMDISAGLGVAVREFPLETGFADYLLYADAKAIGTIEGKQEGFTLTGVETQSAKYSAGLPANLPSYRLPLPFAYESTGAVTQFTNFLDPFPRSREIFTFHRPEELIRLAMLECQLRANLRNMPELAVAGLWNVQIEAIGNLETSLARNRPRALIQMATGIWPSLLVRGQIERRARTTAGIYKISQRDVDRFVVPLPPLEEQEQIVAEAERCVSIIQGAESQIDANLKRSARLRQSVLKRAFEGKLVPQDSDDEPASAMLERLRSNQILDEEHGNSRESRRSRKLRAQSI